MIMLKRTLVAGLLCCILSPVFAVDPLTGALDMMRAGRFAEAARALEPLAQKGDSKALLYLGILYYEGRGVPESEKRAVQLLTESAKKGNVDAMYQLGNAFTFGNQTPSLVEDADTEAASWYFKAASAGHADAQYSLGLAFIAGKGLIKSEKEATYWMQQAAKNGHKDAKNYMAGRK